MSLLNLHSIPSQKPCFAVKVRARSEEITASLLRQKDFTVLAPSYTQTRQYSDRICKVSSALFPGYLFVHMDPRELLRLVSTDGVSYVVRTGRGLEPLPYHEALAIQALCSATELRRPCNYLREGQRVRVESGPFAGVEGLLVQVRGLRRLVVSIDTLHSAVSLEVGAQSLRPLTKQTSAIVSALDTSPARANRGSPV